MNKLKYIILSLSICAGFSACTDDLEQEPKSQITAGSYWKTTDDAHSALIGAHLRLRGLMDFEYFYFTDLRGEFYTYGAESSGGGYSYYFENDLTSQAAGEQWKGLYAVVYDANTILENVPSIAFTDEDEKNQILASAYGLRAYVYSILARTYGDVPLLTENASGYTSGSSNIARSAVNEIYEQISIDITEALTLFGEDSSIKNKYYISKPAVYALQAEVALTKARFLNEDTSANADIAIAALEKIMSNSSVALVSNFADIFDTTKEKGSEIVWAMPFDQLETSSKPFPSRMYPTPDGIADKEGAENLNSGSNSNSYQFVSFKKEVCEMFDPTDARKDETFAILTENGNYFTSVALKYDGTLDGDNRYYDSDIILFRAGEILLMAAEAHLTKGEFDLAISYIEEVRTRAGLTTNIASTEAAVTEALINEYMFETMGEGKRWYQMLRFGAGAKIKERLTAIAGNEYLYYDNKPTYHPISVSALTNNASLKQTVGY